MKFHPVALVLVPKVIHPFSGSPSGICQCPSYTRALLKGILSLESPRMAQPTVTSRITAPGRDPQCLLRWHHLPRNLR